MSENSSRENKSILDHRTKVIFTLIGGFYTAISISSFYFTASSHTPNAVFQSVIDAYGVWRDHSLGWVGQQLSEVFASWGIQLRTSELWAESVGAMGAYFTIDYIQNYWRTNRARWHKLATVANAIFVTLTFPLLGDNLGEPGNFNILYPIFGFVAYEIIKAPISSLTLKPSEWNYWFSLRWYLFYFAFMNFVLGVVATLPKTVNLFGYDSRYDVVLFVFFWLLLLIRNVAVTWYRYKYKDFGPKKNKVVRSSEATDREKTTFEIVLGSGSFKIARTQLIIIVAFAVIVSTSNEFGAALENFSQTSGNNR